MFTLRNIRETVQAIKGRHIRKATKYVKDVTVQKRGVPLCCCSSGVGGAQAKSGAGCRVGGPKSAGFSLHRLKNAEQTAEHKGKGADALVTEPHEQNSRGVSQNLQCWGATDPACAPSLWPTLCSSLRRSRLLLMQSRGCREGSFSEETHATKRTAQKQLSTP